MTHIPTNPAHPPGQQPMQEAAPTAPTPLALDERCELADSVGDALSQPEQSRILALEAETEDKMAILAYLSEQVHREEEIYWNRFQAFAAIHAGALVLVTSNVVETKLPAAILGFALALFWGYVQWISLKYGDRPKRLYHWYRRSLGILWPHELTATRSKNADSASPSWTQAISAWIQRKPQWSASDLGARVPWLVGALWALAIIEGALKYIVE